MSVTGLVLSLVLLLFVLAWVFSPFITRVNYVPTDTESVARQRERLQLYYERVLRNIRDLDEDRATGKLNEDEYAFDRARWTQRGVAALKALDELDTTHLIAPSTADDAMIDEAIDRAIGQTVDSYQDQVEST